MMPAAADHACCAAGVCAKGGDMTGAWTEIWSFGRGSARTYCGIARTEEGFAVDVFHGFTCLETTTHATYEDARVEAKTARTRYRSVTGASRKARHFSRDLLYASWPIMADCANASAERRGRRLTQPR
jgi:hypothetical protein